MTTQYRKPLPTVSGETKPFWDAARQGRLLIQQCRRCQEHQWYPRGFCANCWSHEIAWVEASGQGVVWTYTITHQNRSPGFQEEVPYVLALVTLEEGVKVFTNVVECNPQDVYIGMPVQVVFREATPAIHIPYFRPAG